MMTKTIWLILSLFMIVFCQEKVTIPEHLLECYENRTTQSLLPMSIFVMIDLIRKVELYPNSQLNMRMLVTSLLHSLRMDGLERDPNVPNVASITPFRASGFQFNKFRILFHQLIPGNSQQFPYESLSTIEKCSLHFMISSTVNPWERGNEQEVCPNSFQDYRPLVEMNGSKVSSCPVEYGVVLTDSGTINMGNVLAGLAAALEPLGAVQSDLLTSDETKLKSGNSLNNQVLNKWAATLAGDLAEVIVFQAAQTKLDMKLGFSGKWNDSYFPAQYYMTVPNSPDIAQRYWHITDAELLGGVDGLILGNIIGKWPEKYTSFRLSQLLEMFYFNHGVNSASEDRACNREKNFQNIFEKNQEILLNQTQFFTEILSTKTPHYFIERQFIEEASKEVIKRFKLYYPEVLRKTRKCLPEYEHGLFLDLFIIMDATWTNYDALQLLIPLSERIDVSPYGSVVTVVNGDSGDILINEANSISDLYIQWINKSNSDKEVNDLSLEKSLLTLVLKLEGKTERQHTLKPRPRRSESPVVLILGYSSTVSDRNMKGAKIVLQRIKSQYPASKFVYLTSRINAPRFVHLTALPGSQTDSLVAVEDNRLSQILPKLQETLFTVPRSLTPIYCSGNNQQFVESFYEEYISLGNQLYYWIHPDYLCGSDDVAKYTFKNYDYGQLRICMSRDRYLLGTCQEADLNKETTFFLSRPCERQGEQLLQWNPGCLPVYFTVTAIKSLTKCLENECKYPDQVKFSIIIQGLKCVTPFLNICSSAATGQLQYIFVILKAVFYFVIYCVLI